MSRIRRNKVTKEDTSLLSRFIRLAGSRHARYFPAEKPSASTSDDDNYFTATVTYFLEGGACITEYSLQGTARL